MFQEDIPESLPECPLTIRHFEISEVAFLYWKYDELKLQQLYNSYSEEEWSALAGRPAAELIQRESALREFADILGDCRFPEPVIRAIRRFESRRPRRDVIGLDPHLDAEYEAATARLFETGEDTRKPNDLLAAAREDCRRGRVKFTPADEAQREHYRSKGGWLGFVYEGDQKFRTEEQTRGNLESARNHLEKTAAESRDQP